MKITTIGIDLAKNSGRRASGPPSMPLRQLRACLPETDRVFGLLGRRPNTQPAPAPRICGLPRLEATSCGLPWCMTGC